MAEKVVVTREDENCYIVEIEKRLDDINMKLKKLMDKLDRLVSTADDLDESEDNKSTL